MSDEEKRDEYLAVVEELRAVASDPTRSPKARALLQALVATAEEVADDLTNPVRRLYPNVVYRRGEYVRQKDGTTGRVVFSFRYPAPHWCGGVFVLAKWNVSPPTS